MDTSKFKTLRPFLLIAAIFGFLTINIPFLWFTFFDHEVYSAAMNNGMTRVFIGEAFILMLFFAFMIAKLGWKKPGWVFFIAMSLLGSMAFSIPLQLYLTLNPKKNGESNGESD